MSQNKLVDQAFLELTEDPEDTYILSNLIEDLTDPNAVQYFLEKLRPFDKKLFSEYQGELVRDLLTQWARSDGAITTAHFKEVSDWVESNIDEMDKAYISTECLQMASFYSVKANIFHGDEIEYGSEEADQLNARFSDPKMVEYWIEKAMLHAMDVDDWVYIIEIVAQPHSGLHMADVEWGKKILERGMNVLEPQQAKKLAKKAEAYF